jgi:hypothetical protein
MELNMSIKLNKHTLSDDTLKQMKLLMDKSKQQMTELGFSLCADDKDILKPGKEGIGGKLVVEVKKECGENEMYAGSYHTHPGMLSLGSPGDLIHCGVDHNICISGQIDNKTRCYIWKDKSLSPEKYTEFASLYNKGIRKIDDPIHEKNFECMKEFAELDRESVILSKEREEIDEQNTRLQQIEKQQKAPKQKIDKMKRIMDIEIDKLNKKIRETNNKVAKLTPKYYKEKVL